jgi:hypothetical protein
VVKALAPIVLLILCAAASSCAPPAIPFDASVHWSLKGGFVWTWTRRSDHGCGAWRATDRWAIVQIVIDSRCDGRRDLGYLAGRGVAYSSFSDRLVFRGFWPWTRDDYFNSFAVDSDGVIRDRRLCPQTLSPEQIEALRVVTQEVLARSKSDAERRLLARVDDRLAATNGEALSVAEEGCTDSSLDGEASIQMQDLWDPR